MLDDMATQGIIAPVTVSTEWTHLLVVVAKSDKTPRLCVDLTNLNKFVKRPLLPLTTPKQAVSGILKKSKLFCTYDDTHGYWQIPLAEDIQLLTTFITPWGRYKFLRGPMGLVSTGDEYCRRTDSSLGRLPRLHRVVDDILAEAPNLTTCYNYARTMWTICRDHNITLGKKKFKLAVTKASFAGYIISQKGVATDPSKVEAIARETNQLHSDEVLFCLVKQLGDFCPKISAAAIPLRPLLREAFPS